MLGLYIDRSLKKPITNQIYGQLRNRITSGELETGFCLPSTRQLASELMVSRNIIIEVYDQLLSEGFLEAYVGSRTYVAGGIHRMSDSAVLSPWEDKKSYIDGKKDIINFASGIPDLNLFPVSHWLKCAKDMAQHEGRKVFGYGTVFGDPELREQIAKYVFISKGISCSPENVMIVSGASQGFQLIADVLSGYFDEINMEEPSVDFIRDIFLKYNYGIVPVKVDKEGACINELIKSDDRKLLFLTPSNQFPTGSILSIKRKQAVIAWAKKTGSIIIEDDYDSEFRYKGVLLPPLLTMDYENVIYVGTFSKNLSPGLRLGYVILPLRLKKEFKQVKADLNMYSSQIEQKTLAKFIENGYLEKHIYKMKKIYKEKQNNLKQCLVRYFGDKIRVMNNDAGMHIIAEFDNGFIHEINWNESEPSGIKVYPLKDFFYREPDSCQNINNKVILGYGNLNINEIKLGVERLHKFIIQNRK